MSNEDKIAKNIGLALRHFLATIFATVDVRLNRLENRLTEIEVRIGKNEAFHKHDMDQLAELITKLKKEDK